MSEWDDIPIHLREIIFKTIHDKKNEILRQNGFLFGKISGRLPISMATVPSVT